MQAFHVPSTVALPTAAQAVRPGDWLCPERRKVLHDLERLDVNGAAFELLPKPWPGREARDLLARCRRLGVLARSEKSGPALFTVFDDAIAHLP